MFETRDYSLHRPPDANRDSAGHATTGGPSCGQTLIAQRIELEGELRKLFAEHLASGPVDDQTLWQPDHQEPISATLDSRLPAFAQTTPAVSCQLPQLFGRYCVTQRLGEGGMGMVFRAHDSLLHRDVALKIPCFKQREPAEVIARFYREARAAAGLHHPLICPIYDIGQIGETKYIAMAYVKGQSLAEIIRSRDSLQQSEAAQIVQLLTDALAEAHDLGIIHRDLTPANIIINEKGQPIVVDFGLARPLTPDGDGSSALTQEGVILGTPGYMSPEQVEGATNRLGPATDIYSLGVVLYRLLTGRLPFTGSCAAVLGKIATQPPPRPSDFTDGIDLELEAICLKMMAKHPGERYASMRCVDQALSEYLSAPS